MTMLQKIIRDLDERYPQTVLLFEVLNHFEILGSNAAHAATLLNITITDNRCGIHKKDLQKSLAIVTQNGYKAAIIGSLHSDSCLNITEQLITF